MKSLLRTVLALIALATAPFAAPRRARSRSICCWCWPPTSRAASTIRNSCCSVRAMPRRSRTRRCSTPSAPACTARSRSTFLEWSGVGAQKVVIDWTVDRRPGDRPPLRRPAGGSAALVRGPHLDQRRHRVFDDAVQALAVRVHAPHHRRLRRRHQQCRTRRAAGARRGAEAGRHHQRPGDPERAPGAVESRSTPIRRAGSRSIIATTSSADRARSCVAADGFESFGRAIIKKMIAEIAMLHPFAGPYRR